MRRLQSPLALLTAIFAGWMNRDQQAVIDYLATENRILKARAGKRMRFTDAERRQLARKGAPLGRRILEAIASIVTPDTILAWHRKLVAAKWTYKSRRARRTKSDDRKEIEALVVRFATENPGWGYDKIEGALMNLGHDVASNTIKAILRRHGIEPSPERRKHRSWNQFLKAHVDSIVATDFFTTEVWTLHGLVTRYVLFAIDHATRAIQILGSTARPNAELMVRAAQALADGILRGKRFLIADRDSKFSDTFKAILAKAGIDVVHCPPSAPDCNAIAERWVRSVRDEVVDQMVFFGAGALDRSLAAYEVFHNRERNHQGIGNVLIHPRAGVGTRDGPVQVRERLGGLLNYYFRRAG